MASVDRPDRRRSQRDRRGADYNRKRLCPEKSVDFAALTAGFGGSTDAWGTSGSLAARFDTETSFLPWGATTGWTWFGHGAAQMFSGALSGADYRRTCSDAANAGAFYRDWRCHRVDSHHTIGFQACAPMDSLRWSAQ